MMRLFFVYMFVLAVVPALAQEEINKKIPEIPDPVREHEWDTSEVQMNGKKIIIITDRSENSRSGSPDKVISVYTVNRNRVWQGFEIGFTGVSYTEQFDTKTPPELAFFDPIVGTSLNWAINPFELDIRIAKEYLKFSTGLGYSVKNFSLENNYVLTKNVDGHTVGYQDSYRTLNRNRFRTGYITVPAMMYFNTNKDPEKAFRIGAGVVGGLKVFEAYRLKYECNGQRIREKYNGSYNSNPYLLDIRTIIGFGNINIYATYSTLVLFVRNKGPEVCPFTFGISFGSSY